MVVLLLKIYSAQEWQRKGEEDTSTDNDSDLDQIDGDHEYDNRAAARDGGNSVAGSSHNNHAASSISSWTVPSKQKKPKTGKSRIRKGSNSNRHKNRNKNKNRKKNSSSRIDENVAVVPKRHFNDGDYQDGDGSDTYYSNNDVNEHGHGLKNRYPSSRQTNDEDMDVFHSSAESRSNSDSRDEHNGDRSHGHGQEHRLGFKRDIEIRRQQLRMHHQRFGNNICEMCKVDTNSELNEQPVIRDNAGGSNSNKEEDDDDSDSDSDYDDDEEHMEMAMGVGVGLGMRLALGRHVQQDYGNRMMMMMLRRRRIYKHIEILIEML